ncbi:MAG: hypothetical protein IIY13_01090 [Clostridia bacterium]|nr:hypothetical protein [Clostridia bacterium]
MARICPLCSGSSGNSTYISFGDGAILVDAGASCKSLLESVAAVGSIDALRAVDLRAGAAMIIAGLMTEGVTEVEDILHIDRGYENIAEKFCALGADIKRVPIIDSTVALKQA